MSRSYKINFALYQKGDVYKASYILSPSFDSIEEIMKWAERNNIKGKPYIKFYEEGFPPKVIGGKYTWARIDYMETQPETYNGFILYEDSEGFDPKEVFNSGDPQDDLEAMLRYVRMGGMSDPHMSSDVVSFQYDAGIPLAFPG